MGPQLTFRRCSDNLQSSPEQRQSVGRSQETRGRLYPGGRSSPRHAVNQHFPLGFAAGVGGYFDQQVTNDHGSGDQFGAFRGHMAAVGPSLSYMLKAGAQELNFSARSFHEFDVETGSKETPSSRPSNFSLVITVVDADCAVGHRVREIFCERHSSRIVASF